MASDGPADPTQAMPPPEPQPGAPSGADPTTLQTGTPGGAPPGEPPVGGEGGGPDEPSSNKRRNLVIAMVGGIVILLLLLFFLLRDDSPDEVETVDSTTTTELTSTTSTSTTTETTSTTTTTTTAPTTTTTTTPPAATLTLAQSGLGAVSFGQGQAAVVSTVSGALGAPSEEGPQTDCPAGNDYRVRWESLFLDFRGGSFVGWEYRGGIPSLSTGDGITVGSTVGQAAAVFPGFSISVTSLGPEFTSDFGGGAHISGIATDTADSGQITSMWAGDTCIFR